MKIWQRHIFFNLSKTFLFLLVCLYIVYITVDLSAHGVRFLAKSNIQEIFFYYIHTFSSLLELFFTLTFLLASMRTLFDLNTHQEIVALQMAGLSKKTLLIPFFLFATLISLVCYANSEWLAPTSLNYTSGFKKAHKDKKKAKEKVRVSSIYLKDGSELVYQNFDSKKNELFDVFWVRNPNDIWHMKTLEIESLEGSFVHHFRRNSLKQLEKTETFTCRIFSDLPWDEQAILHKFIPFENRPISTLICQASSHCAERRSVFSHLYYKLFAPLMPFLVLIAISPISIRFSRSRPFFLIAACSILGFVGFKTILDGMLILGENQVLPSYVAILSPILLLFSFSLPQFVKMR